MELKLLERSRVLAIVGRGPRRQDCLRVVEAFFEGTRLSAWPEPTVLGAFAAEGLACASQLQGRALSEPPSALEPFARVGEGIADAVVGRLRTGDGHQDGHGFGAAMFRPARTLDRAWAPDGAGPAFDHGVGRALWFRSAGSISQAVRASSRFPDARREAVLHGVGFALAFAGDEAHPDPRLASGIARGAGLRGVLVDGGGVG